MTREEAIKEIKKAMPYMWKDTKEAIQTVIPELFENENERIIRFFAELATDACGGPGQEYYEEFGLNYDKVMTWLGKQKKSPKSADSIPSDCISDAKCENKHNEEGDFVFELRQIISSHRYSDIYGEYTNDEEGMASEILELCRCELEKQKEQKPAEWSKNDTVFLNEITDFFENKTVRLQHDLDMYAHWLTSLPERFNLQPKQEWNGDDNVLLSNIINIIQNKKYVNDDAARKKYVDFLKSIRPQPKNEWSEEDKRKLNRIYAILGHAADDKGFLASKRIIGDKEAVELQDFLKFLRNDGLEAGKERTFKQFSDILDKWEEHAIRGMEKGAAAYHQGKIALICDLRDWIKTL